MITSQDLQFIAALAQSTSLADASRRLDVTPPAVSQRLRALETRLGVRLMDRIRGAIHLTAEGEILARRAAEILGQITDLGQDVTQSSLMVSGPLRVIAPFGFGRAHVAGVMSRFGRKFPDVTLNLALHDAPYSAARSGNWDVQIHIGPLPDSAQIQRKLAPNRRILCAAPGYLAKHGQPRRPADLSGHRCGVIREDDADVTMWNFQTSNGQKHSHRITPAFTSNDGQVIRDWAIDGHGITARSEWDVAAEIANGTLVEVMTRYRLRDADIIALISPRTGRAARTQHFLDMLVSAFSPPPWRSAG